jgi:glycosyltransferase involved in cell wall biosynthesis
MRIGIFNRWLHTHGGAERQTGAAAQALAADGHDVSFITTTPTDLAALARRFSLDLTDVGLRVVPDVPYSEMTAMTAEYDLFINGSFMDALPSRAPASILFIYFPRPSGTSLFSRLARTLAASYEKHVGGLRYEYGFYNLELATIGWYRAISRRAGFSVPGNKRGLSVQLAVSNLAASEPLPACFSTQGTELARIEVAPNQDNHQLLTLQIPPSLSHADRVTIDVECAVAEPDPSNLAERRALGIAIGQVTTGPAISHFIQRLVERNLPRLMYKLRIILAESEMDYLESYDRILANSAFTASWLQRFWDAKSDVLYPPVDTVGFKTEDKQRVILSTGRFFVGGHSKRQDVLVEAFGTLVAGGTSDWHLHLVGKVGERPADREYFAHVQKLAEGLPVTCHANADFATLQDLSAQASLYWHAAGFGVNEDKDPLRVEHFGISVVEAMAAGAIPIAVGKGGVTEIITPGKNGLLWNTPTELVSATRELIGNPTLRARLSTAAIARSQDFSQERYGKAMQHIVRQIAAEKSPG